VGSDADLAIVDLDAPTTVRADTQHSAAEYSPWEGRDIPLTVVHTLIRGHFAVRDGKLSETPTGTYLSRTNGGAAALASQKEFA
jgi:dihydropyrimidinase